MATRLDPETPLDMREQIARIDKMQAELQKIMQEMKLVTPQMIFQGALATAAIFGAGIALAGLFL